jgi:hypothetical protein
MARLVRHVLLPVLGILYVPCDWLFVWALYLPPAAAVAVVGVLSALVVNVLQKYCSDQDLLGRSRADLKRLKERRTSAREVGTTEGPDGAAREVGTAEGPDGAAREVGTAEGPDGAAREAGDSEAAQRLAGLSRRIAGRYFVASLRPALLTVPLIGVVAMWTGSRLGFEPVRPGDTIAVRAHFEDGASGFAHFVPNEGVAAVGSAIAPVEVPQDDASEGQADTQRGPQARWRFRAAGEGTFPFVVRYAGRSYEVDVPVAGRGGRPPDRVTVFNEQTPSRDQLQAVEFSLDESMPAAWWNLFGRWAGLYVLVAVICGVGFRYALRVR